MAPIPGRAPRAAIGHPRVGGSQSLRRFRLDPLRIAVFLLILISLSRLHIPMGLGAVRPAFLLAGLACAYVLVQPRRVNTGGLLKYWPTKVLLALAITACLSAAFGISLGGSAVFILGGYSKVLIMAFLIIAAICTAADLRFCIWAVAISCGVLAFYSIFVFELQLDAGSGLARLNDLYTFDSNDVSTILVMGLPLGFLVFQMSNWKLKVPAALLILGIGAAVARGGSRGGFLGLVAAGVALLVLTPGVSVVKRGLLVLVAGAGLTLFAPTGYWDQMRTITNPTEDYNWTSADGRRQLALRGLDYMEQYPVFGLGINNFARAEGTISEKVEFSDTGVRWTPAHNSFLQAGAEMGVVGLALWSSLIVGGIVAMWRLRKRLPRHWRRGDRDQRFMYYTTVYLPVALVGFAVAALFVSFAYEAPIYILAALMTGTYASVDSLRKFEPLAAAPPGAFHPLSSRRSQAPRPFPARNARTAVES